MADADMTNAAPLSPLSPDNPRWDLRRPAAAGDGERLLITVCVHGNEPCGMLVSVLTYRRKSLLMKLMLLLVCRHISSL